jgi:RimJ/RimL family protein N-acetyltransferase
VAHELSQSEQPADDAPASERRPRQALSAMLWGIDWASHLPVDVGSGVTVHTRTYDECVPFVRQNYARIFHEDGTSPFTQTRSDPAKERYYRLAADFFGFHLGDQMIGLIVGTPSDWSTYYLRSCAVLPEHLGKKILHPFMPLLFDLLKSAGLERVEVDTSPSNLSMMQILTRLSFNVTGSLLTDRWGAHVRLTRYLAEDREDVFLRQFCSGVRFQKQNRFRGADENNPERSSP